MKKYKTIQVSPEAHRIFQLMARQFTTKEREMYLTELLDLIAVKATQITNLIQK